eukprot:2702746-Pleurochrysis_carterae.AAC.9
MLNAFSLKFQHSKFSSMLAFFQGYIETTVIKCSSARRVAEKNLDELNNRSKLLSTQSISSDSVVQENMEFVIISRRTALRSRCKP